MALSLTDLRPYTALLLSALPAAAKLPEFLSALMKDLTKIVKDLPTSLKVSRASSPSSDGDLHVAFFHYTENRPPSWTREASIVDTLNHLVLVCARGRYVAMFFSDASVRDRVFRWLDSQDGSALGALAPIPSGILNAAFVKGETQTLWLSGTHRRVPSKVDNKIISGSDLRYALDPLGDQTYFFTAARSRLRDSKLQRPIGVTPRRSRIWVGSTANWQDFRTAVSQLLELVHSAKTQRKDPLPVLAVPTLDKADFKGISGAYDAALIPAELLDPTADRDAREEAEKWSRVGFTITLAKGPNFTARIFTNEVDGTERTLGTFTFNFLLANPERPAWTVTGTPSPPTTASEFDEAARILELRRSWLKVWYDSGHTLADEAFVVLRYRDQPFDGYLWEDLTGVNVKREKPTPLSLDTIGTQGSLFCWVKKCWRTPGAAWSQAPRGWLACDDGSMEIADFIHLDTQADPPILALIHVKGSKSDDPDRPVSVSDYEIVTGQAVKNLRYLDSLTLAEGLEAGVGKKIGRLVWENGGRAHRSGFVSALRAAGSNYQRIVVVVQPRATKRAVEQARANRGSSAHARLLQLDTLLLAARANCQALGARLYVVGEGTSASSGHP